MGVYRNKGKDNMYLGYRRIFGLTEIGGVGVQKPLNDGMQKFDGSMEISGLRPKTAGRFFLGRS